MILVETPEGKEEIAVVDDTTQSDDGEYFDATTIPISQVSMHALCGSTSSATMFTLKLQFDKHSSVALVDTGSDISFIDAKFATRHKFMISPTSPLQVAAANGTTMLSETAYLACPYSIQGQEFSSDFRLLQLQGYDAILGVDWIFMHSPVGFNLKTREFSITKYGDQPITFHDESIPPKHLLIGPRKLYHLLQKQAYSTVIVLNNSALNYDPEPL